MKHFISILIIGSLFACTDKVAEIENEKIAEALKEEILQLESELLKRDLEKDVFPASELVHIVYFKMKEGLSEEQTKEAISTLESLRKIKEVKSLEVGDLGNTGDARAGSIEGLVLQMSFKSLDDLAAYQKNEFHLEQRAKLKDFFGGPPVVYDYFIK